MLLLMIIEMMMAMIDVDEDVDRPDQECWYPVLSRSSHPGAARGVLP